MLIMSVWDYPESREPVLIIIIIYQFYGIRHYIENFVSRKWTMAEVDAADAFYK
jgi:hypothetical protein